MLVRMSINPKNKTDIFVYFSSMHFLVNGVSGVKILEEVIIAMTLVGAEDWELAP